MTTTKDKEFREFNAVSVLHNATDSSNDNYNRYTFNPRLHLIEMSALREKQKEIEHLKGVIARAEVFRHDFRKERKELKQERDDYRQTLETITEEPWSMGPEVPGPAKMSLDVLTKYQGKKKS